MTYEYPPRSFALTSTIAEQLYHQVAADLPIIASGKLPTEPPRNAADLFLTDPAVAILMRNAGVDESLITGEASAYEKFSAFCRISPNLMGTSLFLSAHLLLRRLLDCVLMLNEANCDEIWSIAANRLSLLADNASLLDRLQVCCIYTPNPTKSRHARRLFIPSAVDLDPALCDNPEYTVACHTLPGMSAFVKPDPYHAEIAQKRLTEGLSLQEEELACLAAQQLRILGREYCRRGWRLQLIVPSDCAPTALNALLDYLAENCALPPTLLCLPEAAHAAIAHRDIAFAPDQYHTARSIAQLLQNYAAHRPLGCLCGMAVNANSLLSLVSYDLFRRALCDALGRMVEDGTAPDDMSALAEIVRAVCYSNSARFFGIS